MVAHWRDGLQHPIAFQATFRHIFSEWLKKSSKAHVEIADVIGGTRQSAQPAFGRGHHSTQQAFGIYVGRYTQANWVFSNVLSAFVPAKRQVHGPMDDRCSPRLETTDANLRQQSGRDWHLHVTGSAAVRYGMPCPPSRTNRQTSKGWSAMMPVTCPLPY